MRPTFPAAEVERKREEALGTIASDRDDPSTVADDELLPFLMGKSPLGHPAIGREPAVKSITRDDVVAFHRQEITPDNAILAVVGDVGCQGRARRGRGRVQGVEVLGTRASRALRAADRAAAAARCAS
jgi:predicted Zn-dependent peptidase